MAETEKRRLIAICLTPKCGHIWFLQENYRNEETILIRDIQIRPCPKCGGIGRIPDGRYGPLGFSLLHEQDMDSVIQALEEFKKQIASGKTAEEAKRETGKQFPWVKGILDQLDEGTPLTKAFLVIALASEIIQCSMSLPGDSTKQILVDQEIAQSLSQAVSELRQLRASNQPPPQKPAEQGILPAIPEE